jgi:PKD repeat protein
MKTKNVLILLMAVFGSQFAKAQCKANFSYYVDPSTMTVDFYDSSTSGSRVTDWTWIFGDGTSSNKQNPIHKYNGVGPYTVCLSIFDSVTRCGDTVCMIISLTSSGCRAGFTEWPDTNYLKYSFQSNSGFFGIIHEWTIAGNKLSSGANIVTYTFPSTGTYTACLKITDTVNNCTDSTCHAVVVTKPCYSTFTYSVKGDSMVFQSSYYPLNVKWDFGDSSGSTSANGVHVYTNVNTNYNVCLTVYCSSTDSSTTCRQVYVGSNSTCKAYFTVAIDTSKKFKLFLINKSNKNPLTTYYWDFGDGTSSAQRNPTHSYKTFGRYLVCLTITDSYLGRTCTATYCDSLGLDSSGKLMKTGGFEIIVIDEDKVGIDVISSLKLKIYPNPVTDELFISFENSEPNFIKIEVINSSGQIVFRSDEIINTAMFTSVIRTGTLQPGLYFLKLTGKTGIDYIKFVRR